MDLNVLALIKGRKERKRERREKEKPVKGCQCQMDCVMFEKGLYNNECYACT